MSTNPYAPPTAPVADIAHSDAKGEAPFFAVSLLKMAVLSICTFGLYTTYWFYMNWKLIRDRQNPDIWPIPRALFAIFFIHQLFTRIREHGEREGVEAGYPAGALTAGWIITTLCWRMPEPFSVVALLAFLFILPVQAYVNRVNQSVAPDHDRNAGFTVGNWIGVVLGGILLSLALIGTFMPAE